MSLSDVSDIGVLRRKTNQVIRAQSATTLNMLTAGNCVSGTSLAEDPSGFMRENTAPDEVFNAPSDPT
jgi:hypothetical protein